MRADAAALLPEGLIRIGEAELHYRWIGPGPEEAPTVVMLHEGLGAVTTWRDFPDRLAEATGHGVFVYSRQGYGKSSPCALPRPLDYMTREAVDVVPPLLDAIGFRRGALLGHSDGGSIAAVYCGRFDDPRVEKLILLAPHFFNEDCCVTSIAEINRIYQDGLRDKLKRHHGDNVDCAFRGWADSWLHPDFLKWNIEADLAGVATPTLVIQGKDDEYGTIAQIEAVRRHVTAPVTVAHLDDCGHSPFRDRPDATLDAISAFLHA